MGVKLVASQMVGLDDIPITSSESDYLASSDGDIDIHNLYEWFQPNICKPLSVYSFVILSRSICGDNMKCPYVNKRER